MISQRPAGKSLSVFSLVMINIIAVDSLRTLPISAEYGTSLIFFYAVAAVVFFLPLSLISAELATAYPETGGLYIWVRAAFGPKCGFMAVWMQWIYNVVWYPTILAFIASTLAYLFNPALASQPYFLFTVLVSIFWLATCFNLFGMRVSAWVSSVGALLGTVLPMLMIIGLAIAWLMKGYPSAIHFVRQDFLPHQVDLSFFVLLTGVLFGLAGMEMSAVHAGDVTNPQRDYPRALAISTLLIFFTLVMGSLAVAIVVPKQQLNLVTGVIDAFAAFFSAFGLRWLIPCIVIAMMVGGISSVSAWVIGPSKGLMVASQDGLLPAVFFKTNRYGAPVVVLISQAIIFTLLSTVFVFFDSINASYWMLSALTEQIAMAAYVLLFSAAAALRYKAPQLTRPYKIPGGNGMMLVLCGLGIVTCLIAIGLGYVPPSHVKIAHVGFYESFLVGGMVLFMLLPAVWLRRIPR